MWKKRKPEAEINMVSETAKPRNSNFVGFYICSFIDDMAFP